MEVVLQAKNIWFRLTTVVSASNDIGLIFEQDCLPKPRRLEEQYDGIFISRMLAISSLCER
jgi:hypothetical protein